MIINLIGQYRSRENEGRFRWYTATRNLKNTPAVIVSYPCRVVVYFNETYRINHRGCSVKKGVLRNFAKFTGKHLRQRLFSNKVAHLELY